MKSDAVFSQLVLCFLFLQLRRTAGVCPGDSYISKIPLYFGFMAPTDPNGIYNGQGSVVAVNLALERVNSNDSLLYGYNLFYNGINTTNGSVSDVFDSKCDRTAGLQEYFRMVSNPPFYIAALATGCSTSTEPVGELTHFWNFPLISYGSAAPVLSTRSRFPSLFRTYWSDATLIPAFIAALQNRRPLRNALEDANITISEQSFTFPSDVDADIFPMIRRASEDLENHIFFINTFEKEAKRIVCAFYKLGIRYPAYAFITHGWFQPRWWSNDVINFTVPCTEEELLAQLDRTLAVQQNARPANLSAPTISGLSSNQFDELYRSGLNEIGANFIDEGFSAYDAVWTLALALNKVQRAICTNDNLGCNISQTLTPLEDYQYFNAQMECMLNRTLNATGFEGVTGYINFGADGTREETQLYISQYQTNEIGNDTVRSLVGDISTGGDHEFTARNTTVVWPEGIPPDGTPFEVMNSIEISVAIIFDVLAVVGIIFALTCLVFNIVFRNRKIIKLTSPNLNYVIAIGALISYSSVILQLLPGLDVYSLCIRCIAGYWLNIIGYTLSFSAVLARMWRVNYIFHNPTPNKRNLKDWYLLCLTGVLTLVVIALLTIGEAIEETRHTPTLVNDTETRQTKELNVTIQYFSYSCYTGQTGVAYQAVVLAYLFVLQVIGIVLAFQTRKVTVKALNDSKQVAAIVYITSVSVVITIMTVFALNNFINTSSALFGFSTMFSTTAFLILIFIPKMYSLYKDPEGENVFTTSKDDVTGRSGIISSSEQNRKASLGTNVALSMLSDDPRATIILLQSQVEHLQAELRKYQPPGSPRRSDVMFSDSVEHIETPSSIEIPNCNGKSKVRISDSVEHIETPSSIEIPNSNSKSKVKISDSVEHIDVPTSTELPIGSNGINTNLKSKVMIVVSNTDEVVSTSPDIETNPNV